MSEELIEGLPPLICAAIGAIILCATVQWFDSAALKSMEENERQWELQHKS